MDPRISQVPLQSLPMPLQSTAAIAVVVSCRVACLGLCVTTPIFYVVSVHPDVGLVPNRRMKLRVNVENDFSCFGDGVFLLSHLSALFLAHR